MATEAPTRDRFITLNGLRFHYRGWGREQAEPLILLHGLGSHAGTWELFAREVADSFRVLALDQRGHGQSDWADEYTLEGMAADTHAFVQALGLGRFALVGSSMGGINAYLYAARHPETLTRLVIVDIAPDVTDILAAGRAGLEQTGWSGWPAVVATLDEARALAHTEGPLLFADPEDAVGQVLARAPNADAAAIRQSFRDNLVRRDDGRWTWRSDPVFRSPIVGTLPSSAAQWALMPQITCPTLLVRGANSPMLSRETAERLARAIPACRLIEVPDAGHAVALDNPRGFSAAVRPFLLAGTM